MPFVEVSIREEIEKQRQEDPEFRAAWDSSREEYRLIGEMISLRKKESSPSLRLFCNIIDALGYELKIVKKEST